MPDQTGSDWTIMAHIPVLHEAGDRTARKPIIQFKELEPDWQRYNSWRASLIESYANWLRRWKRLQLDKATWLEAISNQNDPTQK
jgi:hypothetical protein